MQRMPIKTNKGEDGLLKFGTFGETLLKELPDYTERIRSITSTRLLTALFRDYTFAASAYLLEPCDLQFRKDKTYGEGSKLSLIQFFFSYRSVLHMQVWVVRCCPACLPSPSP